MTEWYQTSGTQNAPDPRNQPPGRGPNQQLAQPGPHRSGSPSQPDQPGGAVMIMAGVVAALLLLVGVLILRSRGDGEGGDTVTVTPIEIGEDDGDGGDDRIGGTSRPPTSQQGTAPTTADTEDEQDGSRPTTTEETTNSTTTTVSTTLPPTPSTTTAPPEPDLASAYRGTATFTVEIYDFCTPSFERQLADTIQLQAPVEVLFGPPASDGEFREPNDRQMIVSLGDTSSWSMYLISAAVATTPDTGRQLLLQYWDLDIGSGSLSGTLVDDHRREAAAANALSSLDPLIPCRASTGVIPMVRSLAVGTTVTGRYSGSELGMTIEGTTYDDLRRFRVVIEAGG